MIEPWQTYKNIQPISAAGMTLVDAFGQLVLERWDIHGFQLPQALQEHSEPDEVSTSALVFRCAIEFQEAVVLGKIATSVRAIRGGPPIALSPTHWEIDDPLPRISTGLMNLENWADPAAEPTHRIFVDRRQFKAFISSYMTEDEIWQALSVDDRVEPVEAPLNDQSECRAPGPALVTKPQRSNQTSVGVENRILRRPEVIEMCGISRSTIDNYIKAGNFPQRVSMGANTVGWYLSDITAWIESRRQQGS